MAAALRTLPRAPRSTTTTDERHGRANMSNTDITRSTATMKNKSGEYLVVSRSELFFKAFQGEAKKVPSVTICRKGDTFAFGFQLRDGLYYPMVSGDELELVKDPELSGDAFWFERENLHSDYYCLRSVVTPQKRLCRGHPVRLQSSGDFIEITHICNHEQAQSSSS